MVKTILDATCGSRMIWFDKHNPNVIYLDNRELETELCDGRKLEIKPDIIGDFRSLPFPENSFKLVVFDPPHLLKAGEDSWLAKKYGLLGEDWENDIRQGFNECMRVLDEYGVLIFKWSEDQISTSKILKVISQEPLFGSRRGKTIWLTFMKGGNVNE